ncbi:hypothetical protein SDC9_102418 [bioreactor metagenome]|uniref:Uncharacterized protein n=1 Tax=bioreactor metagenome TaxID=1076179 RepID=A0A645ATI1_9ZZZZ
MCDHPVFIFLLAPEEIGNQVADLLSIGEDADTVFFLCRRQVITYAVVDMQHSALPHREIRQGEVGMKLDALFPFIHRDAVHRNPSGAKHNLFIDIGERAVQFFPQGIVGKILRER